MRLAVLLLVASLIPIAVRAQQPADSTTADTARAAARPSSGDQDQYRTGARFSDLLVVRGERVGLRASPAAGPLGLTGRLRFRGPQTMFDDRLPLVILDGMRLDAASGLLGGTLRLEEINPEEIESIEVLSPAQSVRYGPGAANGVLLVQTRQGHRGSPQWRGYAEIGTRTPSDRLTPLVGGFDAGNPDSLLRDGGCTLLAIAAGSCAQDSIVALASPLSQQLRSAVRRQYGLSVTGGWDRLSYYVAGEFDGDGSPFSLSQGEIDRLQSGGQAVSRSIRFPEHTGRANVSANFRVQPVRTLTIGLRGMHVSRDIRAPVFVNDPSTGALYDLQTGYMTPGDAFQDQTVSEATRWLGNVDVAWVPTRALTFTGNIGHDGARFTSARQGRPGVLTESAVINSNTLGLGADYVWGFSGLHLTSHVGFERSSINRDSLECASTSPNCSSGAYRTYNEQYWQRFWSIVLEQRAIIHDALELVGTVRRDQFRFWNDKPVHAALHASWWHRSLRLRADYGTAGRRPFFFFTQPERTRELSTGLDLTGLSGRVSAGATVYDMRSSTFAWVQTSGSSGSLVIPVSGAIGNRGIELNATAHLIERPNMTLTLEASAWGNKNRFLSASLPGVFVPTGIQQGSWVGYPVGGYWAYRPPAYSDANGNGIIERNEISGPIGVTWVGTPYPTQGATLAPQFGLRAMRMGASLDYQAGHVVFNRNHLYSCLDGHCPWAVDPATPLVEQAEVAYGQPTPRFFEKGDFLALRELWVTVDAPPGIASALHVTSASITLAGRNLHTWTGYTGVSPEPYAAETQFGDPEAFTEPMMPALQQWSFRVRISY